MKKYDTYKDSGIEWIGEIPEHWSVVKLKYVTLLQGGFAFKSAQFTEEGNAIVRIGDIADTININSCKKYPLDENISDEFKIVENDTLIALSGATVGKSCFINENIENCYINQRVARVKADNKFLHYNIIADYFQKQIRLSAGGSAQENISNGQIENFYIPKIHNTEQTAIVSFLDHKTTQIDTLIEKKEQLVEKLTLKRQAIINEAATKGLNPDVPMKDSGIKWLGEIPEHWEVVKFRHYFTLNSGLSITKANLIDKGIPCLNYGEIHSQYGFEVNPEKDKLKCVTEDYLSTNENTLLSYGDFVFADTSEDIKGSGNFTYLNSNTPALAGYHTIIARLQKSNQYRFFAYQFDSFVFRSQIQVQVKGVKVFSITNKILKEAFLLLPPEKEKAAITQHIDKKVSKISDSIEKLILSIEKLKLYRQSLISEAVTGKIDLRDWEQPSD